MTDSTRSALSKESKAERPKPTVPKSPSAWRPRCTPTSTLSARSFIAQPTISCQRRGPMLAGASPTPRSSPSAWPRRSWASPPTAGSLRPREGSFATSFPSCHLGALLEEERAGARPAAVVGAHALAVAADTHHGDDVALGDLGEGDVLPGEVVPLVDVAGVGVEVHRPLAFVQRHPQTAAD